MHAYNVDSLLNRINRLVLFAGYKPSYTNRVTMLVALLHVIDLGQNPTSFERSTVEAAIGRFTN